jgi:hypothetical protein
VLCCLGALTPAAAHGRTFGSGQVPNVTFGCETRPTFTQQSFDGYYRYLPSGQPDCTWYQGGIVGDLGSTNTGGVPADGRITNVAVRSGPTQLALLRFTIVRAYTASGTGSPVCCFFVRETPLVRPTPNTVSRFRVNLPVEHNTNPANGLRTQDYIGVSAVSGTGALPLFRNGRDNLLFDVTPGNPFVGFFYPRMGAVANDSGGGRPPEATPGVEVTINWTWSAGGKCKKKKGKRSAVAAKKCRKKTKRRN